MRLTTRLGLAVLVVGLGVGAAAIWAPRESGEGPGQQGRAPVEAVPARATLPLPAAASDLFEDVTHAAGIDFVHVLGDDRMSNIVEAVGAGVTVFDFDGDGHLDLYFVQQGWRRGVSRGDGPAERPVNRLYRNRGDGTFEDVTGMAGVGDAGYGFSAVAADVDGDGHLDLYVCNLGPNRLYRNRGDGTFEDVTEKAGVAGDAGACSVAAAFLDMDGDGRLDLYVGNYLVFDPDENLYYAPDGFPGPLAYTAQADVLYRNEGDGSFRDVTKGSGIDTVLAGRAMGVVACDLDGDGRPDVYVANDASANFLFRNLGGGRFEEVAAARGCAYGFYGEATASMGAVVGDYDGDGRPDLYVTDASYGALYQGQPDGSWQDRVRKAGVAAPSASWASWGGAWIDFDNDGDLDLYTASSDLHHPTGRPDLLLENRGDGTFAEAADRGGAFFRASLRGRGAAVLDFDGDGWMDLLVTHLDDRPVLLRNRGVAGHHGLLLDLALADGAQAWGARVVVEAGGRRQVRVLHVPTGYLVQSDPRVHAGLGTATAADRVRITWPDGSEEEHEDVPAGRPVRIVQGRGIQ